MISAIRPALIDDAPAIAAIYAHHVAHGTATFDTVGPDAAAWADRIAAMSDRHWPFLIAEEGGRVVGYAYATQFRDRPAYAHTCEDSIYVAPDAVGQGVGSALLGALLDAARCSGFEQIIAVIGGPEPASVALHRRLDFVERGRMIGVGRKFGQTLDTLYMQRSLI